MYIVVKDFWDIAELNFLLYSTQTILCNNNNDVEDYARGLGHLFEATPTTTSNDVVVCTHDNEYIACNNLGVAYMVT